MSEDEEIKKEQRKGCITTIIIAIVGPIIILAGAVAILLGTLFPSNQDYEKWEWMSMHPCEMAQDIVDSKICIGKTSAEITKILGEPTQPKEPGKWTYKMNDGFSMGPGSSFLIVKFGENDKAILAEHIYIRD